MIILKLKCEESNHLWSVKQQMHRWDVGKVLPERGTENGVGRLDLLPLRRHAAEVALMQRRVEAPLQRGVNVGQSHQVLGFLKVHT